MSSCLWLSTCRYSQRSLDLDTANIAVYICTLRGIADCCNWCKAENHVWWMLRVKVIMVSLFEKPPSHTETVQYTTVNLKTSFGLVRVFVSSLFHGFISVLCYVTLSFLSSSRKKQSSSPGIMLNKHAALHVELSSHQIYVFWGCLCGSS